MLAVVVAFAFEIFADLTEGTLFVEVAFVDEQSDSTGRTFVILGIGVLLIGSLLPGAKNRSLQPF